MMPTQSTVKAILSQIWYAPEHIQLMDPLPPFHRRGIIFAAVIIIICFLWPESKNPVEKIAGEPQVTVPIQSQGSAGIEISPIATPSPIPVAPAQTNTSFGANNAEQQKWNAHQIAAGQTMAQLFRDLKLPVTDVYAMAQVEGENKPLSNLKDGQRVQIRQDGKGTVTGLTIDQGNNQQILFTREANGSFLRVH